MNTYRYQPVRYFVIVFALTWVAWIAAAFLSTKEPEGLATVLLMLFGLFVPTFVTLYMVFASKSSAVKQDFKKKIVGFYRVKPLNLLFAITLMGAVIGISILLSLLFGQSTDQFSFAEGFSFSIGSIPTLLTLVLTASLEDFGWRGYAQDSLANRYSWLKATVIFGLLWGLWHLPLIFIQGTYQANILQMDPWFAVNFFVGVPPMAVLFSWVYIKNERSILACIIFHFFVNFLQELIAMTQVTKCIETFVIYAVAALLVYLSKDMFLSTRHVGRLLEEDSAT